MSNIKDRERFNRLDRWIWKKTYVDNKGRTVLPQKLRQKLGLVNGHSYILWICVNRKNGRDNEFLLEVGVKSTDEKA